MRFSRVFIISLLLLVGFSACHRPPEPSGHDATPIPLAADPTQIDMTGEAPMEVRFDRGTATMTRRAAFRLAGKVCGLNHLKKSKFHGLIPYDLCVAWGRLATEDLGGKVHYKHDSLRLVWVHVEADSPVSWDYAKTHFSNSHLICADDRVCRALGSLSKGDEIELTGYLVDADILLTGETRPREWKTSTVRTDTGLGACETIYVTSVRFDGNVYGQVTPTE
ncbi:MAG: hypothetical protein H6685_02255 [Deltaproteobacteria bacterium]|nr:hypothetical protein [Deltaproteobacteria bacterium]